MTGNIEIHEAEWATLCGHIVFRLNFTGTTHYLSCGDQLRLFAGEFSDDQWRRVGEPEYVTRDDILTLIRQGDEAMWDWSRFMATWTSWAAGFAAGKSFAT